MTSYSNATKGEHVVFAAHYRLNEALQDHTINALRTAFKLIFCQTQLDTFGELIFYI